MELDMSKRRDGSWVRRERIRTMHNKLKGLGEIKLSKFLALCEYTMGLTRTTGRQYLQTLVDLEFIEIDDAGDKIIELSQVPEVE